MFLRLLVASTSGSLCCGTVRFNAYPAGSPASNVSGRKLNSSTNGTRPHPVIVPIDALSLTNAPGFSHGSADITASNGSVHCCGFVNNGTGDCVVFGPAERACHLVAYASKKSVPGTRVFRRYTPHRDRIESPPPTQAGSAPSHEYCRYHQSGRSYPTAPAGSAHRTRTPRAHQETARCYRSARHTYCIFLDSSSSADRHDTDHRIRWTQPRMFQLLRSTFCIEQRGIPTVLPTNPGGKSKRMSFASADTPYDLLVSSVNSVVRSGCAPA